MDIKNLLPRVLRNSLVIFLITGNGLLFGQGLPIANFEASETTVDCRTIVTFTNLSTNSDTYSWSFEGGTPETSTDVNPTVTFDELGDYNITLQASGTGGTDVEIKNDYITVDNCPQGPYYGSPNPIPGRLEAENYDLGENGQSYADSSAGNIFGGYRNDDVDIAWSALGGFAISQVEPGEWLEYTIDVQTTLDYDFSIVSSTPEDSAVIEISLDGITLIPSFILPTSGVYPNYSDTTFEGIELPQGEHVLRVTFLGEPVNLEYFDIFDPSNSTQTPYLGAAISLPGVLQAEYFDEGGAYIAYEDDTPGNAGGEFRSEDVDIYAAGNGTSYAVGDVSTDEWLEYETNITGGTYDIRIMASSEVWGSSLALLMGTDTLVQSTVTYTGDLDTYFPTPLRNVEFPDTSGTLTLAFTSGELRIDSIWVGDIETLQQTAYMGQTHQIPGTIQAEHYDEGEQDVAYYDLSPGNDGGQLRNDHVDIGFNGDSSGYAIGWVEAGEWLEYQVDVTGGTYDLVIASSTPTWGSYVALILEGDTILEEQVIVTGDWDVYARNLWSDITLPDVNGTLRMAFTAGEMNIDSIFIGTLPQSPYLGAPHDIPGVIQAEDYDIGGQGVAYNDLSLGNAGGQYRNDDVDVYYDADSVGYVIGWVEYGEWVEYQVNVTEGNYDLIFSASSLSGGYLSIILNEDTLVEGDVTTTGDWETYALNSWSNIAFPNTSGILKIAFTGGSINLDSLWIGTLPQSPYNGIVHTIPGVIQAEDYDEGGQGAGYNDNTPGNSGDQYRTEDVDIVFDTDSIGYALGYVEDGEWVEYSVDADAGIYDMVLTTGTPLTGATITILLDGEVLGSTLISPSGDWDLYSVNVISGVVLPEGNSILQVAFSGDAVNLDSMWFGVLEQNPFGGVPHAIPGIIEAEDYDEGGHGIAYHDLTAGNTGNVYRFDDVDMGEDGFGGYTVGWIQEGEWLEYTVDVANPGTYNLQLAGGTIYDSIYAHIEFDGVDITGPILIPNTGSWDLYDVVNVGDFPLDAGEQVMRIVFDNEGIALDKVAFSVITDLNESHDGNLSVFPNPVSGNTIAVSQEMSIDNVSVLNSLGQQIPFYLESSGNQSLIHLETEARGNFFLKFETESGPQYFQITKF